MGGTSAADGGVFVPTPRGRLFARRWDPPEAAAATDVPLVLLHDSLGSVAQWRDFPERLAAGTSRSVIAYDRLGFGRSDAFPGRIGADFIEAEAGEDFARLRAAFGFDRFRVVGHSVGGGMAVAIAARWPEACVGLVAMAAQAFVEDRTLDGVRIAQQRFAVAENRERLRRWHGDKVDWVLSAWIDSWLAPAFAGWTLDAAIRDVRCPGLIIHGLADEYGSMRHPERIAGGIAGPATLLRLDCGHVPHRELAETVLAAIADQVATSARDTESSLPGG